MITEGVWQSNEMTLLTTKDSVVRSSKFSIPRVCWIYTENCCLVIGAEFQVGIRPKKGQLVRFKSNSLSTASKALVCIHRGWEKAGNQTPFLSIVLAIIGCTPDR
ncbi:hypothetical protein CDAR_601181 [Caerostris darwini]|uniref:Uncharacterized protein n=1 Tax=Caerostris darwini TaxID=1538125 RepID=A0AAV4QEQ3_9ARAC|nr:hypothetical protein CDAR_601181 [Caerostris darwini]